jgi:hypothetical protein
MAIGDAVAQLMGTAVTNRQPSSGVEEQISAIVKDLLTDSLFIYDGSNLITIIGIFNTHTTDNANAVHQPIYNTSIMITNSSYLRKAGTTDRVFVSGVQTNS